MFRNKVINKKHNLQGYYRFVSRYSIASTEGILIFLAKEYYPYVRKYQPLSTS